MKSISIYSILFIVLLFLSSCSEIPETNTGTKLYAVTVTPNQGTVGDLITVNYIIDGDKNNTGICYSTDIEITADGKMKFIRQNENDNNNYSTEESRLLKPFLYTSDKVDGSFYIGDKIPITRYKSISETFIDNGTKRSVTIECYIPNNAKSGYIYFYSDMTPGELITETSDNVRYVSFTVKTN